MKRIGDIQAKIRELRMASKKVWVSIEGYEVYHAHADVRRGTYKFVPAPGEAEKMLADIAALEAELETMRRECRT